VRFEAARSAVRFALASSALVIVLAGCNRAAGGTASPAPSLPAASAKMAIPSNAPSPSPAAIVPASPAPSDAASAGASPSGPTVPIDPNLLAILPSTVAGQTITEIPEIEANLKTDPDLLANAAALAVGLGVNSGTGDFAYVAVVELKPMVFTNAWFVSWRQSYDESACSQSNGLAGSTSTTIGEMSVFVGTCNGGAKTYHVHLPGPDRIVSITSVGSADYGEMVVAGLKP
jgi:hypothetical protein